MLTLLGFVPLTVGALLIVFARQYGNAMLRYIEWSASLMRRPGFLWVYRIYGLIFVAFGITIMFFTE